MAQPAAVRQRPLPADGTAWRSNKPERPLLGASQASRERPRSCHSRRSDSSSNLESAPLAHSCTPREAVPPWRRPCTDPAERVRAGWHGCPNRRLWRSTIGAPELLQELLPISGPGPRYHARSHLAHDGVAEALHRVGTNSPPFRRIPRWARPVCGFRRGDAGRRTGLVCRPRGIGSAGLVAHALQRSHHV